MTKTLIAAVGFAALATASSAAELGYGISFGAESIAEYNVDAEVMTATVEPVIGYTVKPVEVKLEVSTLLSIYDGEFVDATWETLPTLDFRASKGLFDGLEVYGEVSYDLEAEGRGDVVIGAQFNF